MCKKRSNVCWYWTLDTYFEAQVLCLCGFWFSEGIGGQVFDAYFEAHMFISVVYNTHLGEVTLKILEVTKKNDSTLLSSISLSLLN